MKKSKSYLFLLFFSFLLITTCQSEISYQEKPISETPLFLEDPKPSPAATPQIDTYKNKGRIIDHYSNDQIKYNWFSYVPRSLDLSKPIYLMIICADATMVENYLETTINMAGCLERGRNWSELYNYVLLQPIIPRRMSPPIYAVAFDRRVFLNYPEFYLRPDLTVIQMIETLKNELDKQGIKVEEKIFIEGFSAGGMFAQRFTLLHPDLVQAISVGQSGGVLTLPVDIYEKTKLKWPLGIDDFEKLTGKKFDLEAYKKVHQFIYIGSLDSKNSTLFSGSELWTNTTDIRFLLNTFGKDDPERIENQVKYLNSIGFNNIIFKGYPGYVHTYYDAEITDFLLFFKEHK